MKELLSIVINYKTDELLRQFVDSYTQFVHNENRELVIGDVAATLESTPPAGYSYYGWEGNIGYARAVNRFVSIYGYRFENIAIFNADTRFLDSNCVDSCINLLESDEKIAVVGPLQTNSSGQITHAGIFGTNTSPSHRAWKSSNLADVRDVRDAITVSGSAYFIKRSVWEELANDPLYKEIDPESVGAFINTDLYYEETWCSYFARHKGYRVMYNGEAHMIHEHDSSPNSELSNSMKESREIFRKACDHLGIARD